MHDVNDDVESRIASDFKTANELMDEKISITNKCRSLVIYKNVFRG